MKGYDLAGRYEYDVPKRVKVPGIYKSIKKFVPGNRSKILKQVRKHAQHIRDKQKKWVITTENKKDHTFSIYVKMDRNDQKKK